MPQESAQKILSLSFKAITYYMRMSFACISLISRDVATKRADLNERNAGRVTLKKRTKRIPTSER